MNNRGEALLIIGNGFDKSLNLPTSYKEFLASKEFNDFVLNASRTYPSSGLFDVLKQKKELNNWVDVELEIKRFAIEISQQRLYEEDGNKLSEDYRLLKEGLSKYLTRVTENITVDSNNYLKPFLEKISSKSFKVINFNYTDTFHKAANALGINLNPSVNVSNIHGTLRDNNLIFGIDEVNREGEHISEEITFLQKSFHINYNRRLITIPLNNASQVYFYGVSLGESDSDYFKDFFHRLLNDYENKEFCFSFYNESGRQFLHNRLRSYTNKDVSRLRSRHIISYYDCIEKKFVSV